MNTNAYGYQQSQMLPYINPHHTQQQSSTILEAERNKQMQESLRFLQNRLSRSISYANPFKNYPLYPADIYRFCSNYPQSLYYNRPIRYFFQRPVQMDENNCFPHQKKVLDELKERDQKIRDMLDGKNVKYGVPKRMQDLLKNGEVVHYPTATVVSAADLKKKQEEYNKLQEMINKIGPEGQRKIKARNRQLKNMMKKIVYFNDFTRDLRAFTKSSINHRNNTFLHIQATKANINEIKQFMVRILKNLENFCVRFLGEKITIDTTNQKIKEDSIFVVKSFVHQLFNDLSSAFVNKEDVPENIRILFKAYVQEKSLLPPNYLTTFEFNRLEFDVNLRLNRMTNDRQALVIGFIILYRVLLIDVFKNYLTYFPKVRDMGNPIPDLIDKTIKRNAQTGQRLNQKVGSSLNNEEENLVPGIGGASNKKLKPILNKKQSTILDSIADEEEKAKDKGNANANPNDPNAKGDLNPNANANERYARADADAKILFYKKKKIQIRENLAFNFNFLFNVLHHIFKNSFINNPPIYKDYFKNRHLYGRLVYSLDDNFKRVLTDEENTDGIEIVDGLIESSLESDAFLVENARWIHMYTLNTYQFCSEFAKIVMEK